MALQALASRRSQYVVGALCALVLLHRLARAPEVLRADTSMLPFGAASNLTAELRALDATLALLEGEQVNDSAVICEGLLDKMGASGAMGAAELSAFRSPEALEWAKWSDEKFAVLLFPNITRSFSEAYEAFGYVMEVPHFSTVDKWSNQLVGAFAMWMAQGKIKKKYAIDATRAHDMRKSRTIGIRSSKRCPNIIG